MGMSVPDLPPSTSEDNINLGEKDSIRRRALLALEGKADITFNKVEIPDFSTSDMDKAMCKLMLMVSLGCDVSYLRTFSFIRFYQRNLLSHRARVRPMETA